MNIKLLLTLISVFLCGNCLAQKYSLFANGNNAGTYNLIKNSVFSLEDSKSQTQDQYMLHGSYQHIRQQYDTKLGKYVFAFDVHVNYAEGSKKITDGNKGELTDRQRNEIKTMGDEGASARNGQEMSFRWKFYLPTGMKTSTAFCHIHQLKGLGDGSNVAHPVITLTCRTAGSSQELQLIHVADEGAANNYLSKKPLSNFLGKWVEATETYTVGKKGKYSMVLKEVSTGATLMSYSNSNIKIWRETDDESCIRGKWGIYRSLGEDLSLVGSLRSETILFADFETGDVDTSIDAVVAKQSSSPLTYSLAGQRVAAGYKGVVIRDGRKIVLNSSSSK